MGQDTAGHVTGRLGFLSSQAATGDPASLTRAIAEGLRADAVYLQTLSMDHLLTPVAWHASQEELRTSLEQAANEGNLDFAREVPAKLNSPISLWPNGEGPPKGSPVEHLAADTWIEGIGLPGAHGTLRGVLIVLGAASRGCFALSEEERQMLVNVCAPTLAANTELRRIDQLETQLDFLTKASRGLASRKTIYDRLKAAVAAAQSTTGFDSIQLLTWDPTGHKVLLNVLYMQGEGFVQDSTWDDVTREAAEEGSRRLLAESMPLIISDPAQLESVPEHHRAWMVEHQIRFLVLVPLVFEGEHLGTLVITSHYSRERTEDRLRTLTALSGHLAAILQLSLLLAQVEESYQRLRLSNRKTIETLALAAEMRDATTGRHLKHLEKLGVAVGKRLAMSPEDLKDLALGAVVHDIGKLQMPDSVLLKPGRLTVRERKVVETHPELGERILMRLDLPEPVRQIARWHHERWDGKGYPDGLRGDAIPLAVQVITVVDVFDALVSKRPYKEAWTVEQALSEIKRNRGLQLAPTAVDALLEEVRSVAMPDVPVELAKAA